LKAKSRILRRHGRMTAEEESRKTKQQQGECRHRPRFLDHMLMKVKPLSANRILAIKGVSGMKISGAILEARSLGLGCFGPARS
jgi:hypothetical protein